MKTSTTTQTNNLTMKPNHNIHQSIKPTIKSHRGLKALTAAISIATLALSAAVSRADVTNTTTGTGALNIMAGSDNTADGYQALGKDSNGFANTAVGAWVLRSNTTGYHNTAAGYQSEYNNVSGSYNTAYGSNSLVNNTVSHFNTALGSYTLTNNTGGGFNTATGFQALFSNLNGSYNTANGANALGNTSGSHNTAIGFYALVANTSGSNNIAMGDNAGAALTTGSNNIDIGNPGVAAESNAIRIGVQGMQTATYAAGIWNATVPAGVPVYVNSSGKLGTVPSSRRFKQDITGMGGASDALLSLRPVAFRYKTDIDSKGIPQFGLIAEEVDKVAPELVARDDKGGIYGVRYEAVNAMLLNEFLKEHRRVDAEVKTNAEQAKTIAAQAQAIVEQQQQIRTLASSLAEVKQRIERIAQGMEDTKAPAVQKVLLPVPATY